MEEEKQRKRGVDSMISRSSRGIGFSYSKHSSFEKSEIKRKEIKQREGASVKKTQEIPTPLYGEQKEKKGVFKGIRIGADTDIHALLQVKNEIKSCKKFKEEKKLTLSSEFKNNITPKVSTQKTNVLEDQEKKEALKIIDETFSREKEQIQKKKNTTLQEKKSLEGVILPAKKQNKHLYKKQAKTSEPSFLPQDIYLNTVSVSSAPSKIETFYKREKPEKRNVLKESSVLKQNIEVADSGYFFGGIPIPPPKELKKKTFFLNIFERRGERRATHKLDPAPWKTPLNPLLKIEKESYSAKIGDSFLKKKKTLEKGISQFFLKKKTNKKKRRISFSLSFAHLKPFSIAASFVFLFIFSGIFIFQGIALKQHVLGESIVGLNDAMYAVEKLKAFDFSSSENLFNDAGRQFENLSEQFGQWAGILRNTPTYIPLVSKVSSGGSAIEAAKNLSYAGKSMSSSVRLLLETGDAIMTQNPDDASFIIFLEKFSKNISEAHEYLVQAQKHINRIQIDDIPEDKREPFLFLKSTLPEIVILLSHSVENMEAFSDMVGANGPRKYLFLFQNTHEVRATGGFIGSYGFLDVDKGHIRKFFIDDVFNPDGQLRVDIIPPEPIRKISAGWSLHDSNWFADFPLSSQKAMFFYEKAGGPTVDGVISITPIVLARMLEISGPIHIPEYEVTIDSENFMELIQYEVEEGYDPEENRPKKILGELASLLTEKIFESIQQKGVSDILSLVIRSLNEKHILLYSRNEKIQDLYEISGWSGEVLDTDLDYISVVHSNINGFKTDSVIEEDVHHESRIMEDGSVQNTVTVHRKHNGGDTPYQWYNGVNADYLRLYVPKGSQLISVTGHTRESVRDPLDYKTLGFEYDETISQIESTMNRHSSGTQVFEESGKTVFGNWVYVSPKEEVTVTYTYTLPFRVIPKNSENIKSFSSLAQKQSGSMGRKYSYTLQYPKEWSIVYKNKNMEEVTAGELLIKDTDWNMDTFIGVVFE